VSKTVAICQARMGSTRLPGKVMKLLHGVPVISWVVDAATHALGVDSVVVATSMLDKDDVIAEWCEKNGIPVYRGSETDVLLRFAGAAFSFNADIIVRLTCDCPFLDPNVIGEVIQLRKMRDVEYATNTDPASYPDGLDVEVFTRAALESAHREAVRGTDRDTVTRYMVRNRHRFSAANLVCPLPALVGHRWVLDSPEDYEFLQKVAERLSNPTKPVSYLEILKILDKEPWLKDINSKYSRNERCAAIREPWRWRIYLRC
jgi:spore coat polysaccharide biosynthesis protein SpsF (cytidylyltransferase family)